MHDIFTQLTHTLSALYDTPEIAATNAWALLEWVTHKNHAQLLTHKEIILTVDQEARLQHAVHELMVLHKPLQYILGSVPFLYLTISVQPPILIPRPETEEWVAALIDEIKKTNQHKLHILDLCTGTGCIALALAQAFPESSIMGTDINREALQLAEKNARINGITNCTFIHSDMFKALSGKQFDLIVSNPPYLSAHEWQEVQPEIALWEDHRALVAPEEGYALIYEIVREARTHILSQKIVPVLWIEMGAEQGERAAAYARSQGYREVTIRKDWYQKDRVLVCSI